MFKEKEETKKKMTTACLNLPYLFNTLTPDKNIYLKKHIAGRYIIYLSTFHKNK